MTSVLLRFAGWLSLAYLAAKMVAAYYVLMLPSSKVAAALAELLALSPWDTVVASLAALALVWAKWTAELNASARNIWALVHPYREEDRELQCIDALRAELRALAARCHTELAGHGGVDFAVLCGDADQLGARLAGTELELRIAPLWNNLHFCAAIARQLALKDEAARRLRELGLRERAARAADAAQEERVRLMRHRQLVVRTADAVFRATGPLLGRPAKR